MPLPPVRTLALLAAALLGARCARADAVFRPLIADPRESLSRWRLVSYTEDRRYGTDITDSTSRGGVAKDRWGLMWEVAGGNRFRWRPLRRLLGIAPWREYQLAVPAGVFAEFDNSGSLVNVDFQFGASLESQWTGTPLRAAAGDAPAGDAPPGGRLERSPPEPPAAGGFFDHPIVTTRLDVYHRSSHVGDEYLALSRFGRNQSVVPRKGVPFDHPPVKRIDLSYEAVEGAVSTEWAPGWNRRRAAVRAYAGGGAPLAFPASSHIGSLRPRNFRAPWARVGMELCSSGNERDPHDGWLTRTLNGLARDRLVESSWYGALDVRLAKPYNFASGDNPNGETEAWTPRLWTDAPYGREYRHYAGSWHAMLGAVLWPASLAAARTPLAGPEWLLSLEWYRGYSPDGQFLDQRLRWFPRWYVVPSVTARF